MIELLSALRVPGWGRGQQETGMVKVLVPKGFKLGPLQVTTQRVLIPHGGAPSGADVNSTDFN